MIWENRKWLLLSSALCLLPGVLGFALWDRLPEQLSDFTGGNEASIGGMLLTVLLPPLLGLAAQWFCVWLIARDPKNKGRNHKPFRLILWIIPAAVNLNALILYGSALGLRFGSGSVMAGFTGLLFLVVGNYLPKCRQNHTIGIRVPWTFRSEENWNATHRFGGKVWVIGGLLCLAFALAPGMVSVWGTLGVIAAMAVLPIAYSYGYSRKQLAAHTLPEEPTAAPGSVSARGGLWFTGVIVALVIVLCFTGKITVNYGETDFTLKASYWQDMTVRYEDIDSLELRESCEPGVRTWGFGSPKLSMGTFQNGEFGTYTRYAYTGCRSCVVLTARGKTLVISGPDDRATEEIYQSLLMKR